ncbi:MAG TPA: glycosyltransferase [Candidatus Eisenbacteria bacterium]
MKRLLLVAYFYPPVAGGGVYRTLGFVRHLPEFGYEPTVLTGPGAAPWVADPGLLSAVAGVEVVRTPARSGPPIPRARASRPGWISALARTAAWIAIPDAYARWRAAAVRAGLARIRAGGVDAIYSTSPPDTGHLVARDLRRATGLPWLADFRDPWIGLGYRRPPTPWHRARHEALLRSVLREASRVVAATEGTAAWLAVHAGDPAPRATVIENGFEAEEWRGVKPRRFDLFTVLHAGRLSEERTLEPFLRGLVLFLARHPDRRVGMQCLLYGPRDAAQERAIARSGLGDVVRFEGQASHVDALAMEAGADLLLLVKSASPRYRDLVPGKLYEYIGAARPVLAVAPEGPAADLVRRLRMGWVADPAAPEKIAEALDAAWAARAAARGARGRDGDERGAGVPGHTPAEREPFTRRAAAERLAGLLGEIA